MLYHSKINAFCLLQNVREADGNIESILRRIFVKMNLLEVARYLIS